MTVQAQVLDLLRGLQASRGLAFVFIAIGLIANVKEKTVIVRIADNTKIEILRSAVQTVTQRGEGESTPSKN